MKPETLTQIIDDLVHSNNKHDSLARYIFESGRTQESLGLEKDDENLMRGVVNAYLALKTDELLPGMKKLYDVLKEKNIVERQLYMYGHDDSSLIYYIPHKTQKIIGVHESGTSHLYIYTTEKNSKDTTTEILSMRRVWDLKTPKLLEGTIDKKDAVIMANQYVEHYSDNYPDREFGPVERPDIEWYKARDFKRVLNEKTFWSDQFGPGYELDFFKVTSKEEIIQRIVPDHTARNLGTALTALNRLKEANKQMIEIIHG